MTILSALAFVGIGAGAFFGIQYFKKEPDATTRTQPQLENPPATSARPIGASPLMKHIEVAGLRLTQNKAKQTEVRFIIVNHSGAEIQNFSGNINLKARTSKQDEEPIGAFSFKIPMIGPYESKEVTTVVNTKLKVYELPDWQNLEHQIEITSR